MTVDAAIEIEGVSRRFRDVEALVDVSLTAERGQIIGLLGPNGAGKTTLVRMVATLLVPDAGYVRVDGYDAVHQAEQVRRRVGLAGQFAAVDDLLTGRENLLLVGTLYGLGRHDAAARADTLIDQLGIAEASDRRAGEYSGGMRRRLDLCATLIGGPSVLLLDEPTAGLDPRSRGDLWRIVEAIAAQGTTVLLTSQYLEEIDRLASRVVVLDRGRVIAEGPVADLKRRVGGHVIEARLTNVGDRDRAVGALASIAGEQARVHADGERVTVPAARRTDDLVAAVDALNRADAGVSELGLRLPHLDDVFMLLTGTTSGSASDEPDGAFGSTVAPPPAITSLSVPQRSTRRRSVVADVATVTARDLKRLFRTPTSLFFAMIQPILFVLGLTAAFSGLVEAALGGDYIQYLLPGVLVMNVMLGVGVTGVAIADDMKGGMIDRFRSLPMSRGAVLAGRTLTDFVRNTIAMTLMVVAAIALGYRVESFGYAVLAFVLALAFGYSFAWMFAALGLAVKEPQAAQFAGFAPVLPFVYLSSAWLPIETMEPAVQGFARNQPVNVAIEAVRSLAAGVPDWSAVVKTLVWSAAIFVLFATVATRKYAKSA